MSCHRFFVRERIKMESFPYGTTIYRDAAPLSFSPHRDAQCPSRQVLWLTALQFVSSDAVQLPSD